MSGVSFIEGSQCDSLRPQIKKEAAVARRQTWEREGKAKECSVKCNHMMSLFCRLAFKYRATLKKKKMGRQDSGVDGKHPTRTFPLQKTSSLYSKTLEVKLLARAQRVQQLRSPSSWKCLENPEQQRQCTGYNQQEAVTYPKGCAGAAESERCSYR